MQYIQRHVRNALFTSRLINNNITNQQHNFTPFYKSLEQPKILHPLTIQRQNFTIIPYSSNFYTTISNNNIKLAQKNSFINPFHHYPLNISIPQQRAFTNSLISKQIQCVHKSPLTRSFSTITDHNQKQIPAQHHQPNIVNTSSKPSTSSIMTANASHALVVLKEKTPSLPANRNATADSDNLVAFLNKYETHLCASLVATLLIGFTGIGYDITSEIQNGEPIIGIIDSTNNPNSTTK